MIIAAQAIEAVSGRGDGDPERIRYRKTADIISWAVKVRLAYGTGEPARW
jgi:hypothetical protein